MNLKFHLENSSQSKSPDWRGALRRDLVLLLGYFLLALLLTWPTTTHLTTHLPGDGGDDPAIAWNLWWVKYALLNTGQNPFLSDFMFYPIGINLAFYTLTVLNAVTVLPLILNLGVVTASNLHMIFTFLVGAYGTYLLVRYVLTMTTAGSTVQGSAHSATIDHPPRTNQLIWISAAIAGGFYAFASSKLFYVALGQFNIASNHWIPFAVLYVIRTGYNPQRLKNPLMAGLFLTFQAWTEMTYASFVLVFIGLYWLYGIIIYATRLARHWFNPAAPAAPLPLPYLRAAIVMGLTFTVGISPILAQMLPDMLTEGDFLVKGSGFAEAFSADLLGFIIPTMHHPLLGRLVAETNIQNFNIGQHIFLGFILLSLMLVSLVTGYRRPEIRFWLIAAFVFALLCLGPVITINGQSSGIPGPFVILQHLPFFKGNRYPSRYSVMLILSLSVLAGFALAQIGQWLARGPAIPTIYHSYRTTHYALRTTHYATKSIPPKRYLQSLLFLLIPLLFLFEHLSLPLPQSDLRPPPPYQLIAADPDEFTVLDIPFAWRNGFRITGALTNQFMFGQFYQTTHQKRLLQGNTSRNPEFKFQYFTNAPVINSLLALETGKTLTPEQWETDRAIAAEVLRFFNIKYIVVRPDPTGNPSVTPQATLPYIEAVYPVEKIHDDAAIKIYRVDDRDNQESGFQSGQSSSKSGLLIETSSPLAPLYFGEGWGLLTPGRPIVAQRKEVRLLLPLSEGTHQLTIRMRLPEAVETNSRAVYLELNGWQSRPQQIGPEWREITFNLPADVVRPGLNDLRFHFDGVTQLPPLSPNQPPLDVTVLSAGQEVGDFGHLYINGYEVSPNQRGYNIALIQPDGRLRTANFDTHLDSAASATLADFIRTAPRDALIAVAAADEASANLSEAAVQTLHSIGATGDLRDCFRCSHALIGQTGQTPGSALEALDAHRPVGLTTGLGLTEPTLATVVDWIQVEAVEE